MEISCSVLKAFVTIKSSLQMFTYIKETGAGESQAKLGMASVIFK